MSLNKIQLNNNQMIVINSNSKIIRKNFKVLFIDINIIIINELLENILNDRIESSAEKLNIYFINHYL